MKRSHLLLAIIVMGLVFAGYRLLHRSSVADLPTLSKDMAQRFQGVGQILGEEAAEVLGNGSAITLYSQPNKTWISENELVGLIKALKKAGFKVRDSARLRFASENGQPVFYLTGEQLAEHQKRDPQNSAIMIFFGGMPGPAAIAAMLDSNPRPRVIVIDEEARRIQPLVESNIVIWAAVKRYDPLTAGTPEPKTAREQFDHDYQVLDGTSK